MNDVHPTLDQIVDYLHGELPAARDAAVHAHIAGCSDCAQARDAEMQITDQLRERARAEERELPPGLAARIRSAIESERSPSLWERLSAAFRPVALVPVAAAIALLLYVGFGHRGQAVASSIDASYYVQNHAALAATTPFSGEQAVPELLTSDTAPADEHPADETR